MDFVKPFNAFGFPFKRKYKPFKRLWQPFTNRLQSVYFHPFNGKPLVSVFAFQVTIYLTFTSTEKLSQMCNLSLHLLKYVNIQ